MVPEPDSDAFERMMLIVVGAHLRAEIEDRPMATALGGRIRESLLSTESPNLPVVACTDLWYLNHDELQGLPAIVLGNPAQNAAAAWLTRRIPSVLVVNDRVQIQADLEFNDLRVCIWGVDAASTQEAVDLFWSKYGKQYVESVAEQVAGTPKF
jgi:hypothetical protein